MKRLIHFHISQMLNKLWSVFLALLVVICIAWRQHYEGNVGLFVLKVVTDQYLIIFLMMPIFIQCISHIYRQPHMMELIRVRKYYRIMLAKWIAIFIFSIICVVSIGAVASVSAIGLENTSNWNDSISDEVIMHLIEASHSPIESTLLAMGFMIVGYSFLGCTFATLAHFFSRKMMYCFIIVAYLVTILAFKMPWFEALTHVSLSRFVILHHNLVNMYTWQGTIIIIALGLLLQFIIVKKWWYVTDLLKVWERGQFALGKGIFTYYSRFLWSKKFLTIISVGQMLLVMMKVARIEESLQHAILRFFYGYPNDNIHILTWLEQIFYVGIPLYLFALFLQGRLVRREWQLYIRIRHKSRLLITILSQIGLYAMCYVVMTFFILIAITIFFDNTFVVDVGQLIYILGMKMIEISAFLTLLFLMFILTNHVTLSFICTIGLFILNFLPFSWTAYNVAGIGQMARIEEMNYSMPEMMMVGIGYLLLFVILISSVYKKYFDGR